MAINLLSAVQRVRRTVGLDPTITAFSETDESNDNVQDIAEAYEELLILVPSTAPFLASSSSITTSASTRTYSLASDALPYDLYGYSFNDETNNDNPLELVEESYLQQLNPQYDENTGKPIYVYLTGNSLGVYPVPDGVYTINYRYGKTVTTRPSATTDVFLVPDRWVRFIELRAKEKYERRKMMGDPEATADDASRVLDEILVDCWDAHPTYITGEGFGD